jgi:PII-like signaling protein
MSGTENSILKIYASSTDRIGFDLLYERLTVLAKENGIVGVTVYRGIMGFGPNNKQIDSTRFWELTEKLPVVIEMIDKTEKIEQFYQKIESELQKMPKGCLVTMQPVEVKIQKIVK